MCGLPEEFINRLSVQQTRRWFIFDVLPPTLSVAILETASSAICNALPVSGGSFIHDLFNCGRPIPLGLCVYVVRGGDAGPVASLLSNCVVELIMGEI